MTHICAKNLIKTSRDLNKAVKFTDPRFTENSLCTTAHIAQIHIQPPHRLCCASGGSGEIHSSHPEALALRAASLCTSFRPTLTRGLSTACGSAARNPVSPCGCVELCGSVHPPLPPDTQKPRLGAFVCLAEAVRFELTVGSHPRQFSRLLP